MKKIGYYFVNGNCLGGVRQYNLSLLEAIASLPKGYYDIIVFTDQYSLNYVKDYKLNTIFFIDYFVINFFKYLQHHLPIKLYYFISSRFHPVLKTLLAQQCDLWIFPNYDSFNYQARLPSLVTIHDLMHRYEGRFPEVSSEYKARELMFSTICRWSKALLVDSELGKKQVQESYGVNPEKIYVLPYIPSKWIFSHIKIDPAGDHKTLENLPPKFVFYPAQFWEHKNHKRLIQATALLKDKIPDLTIIFVGSQINSYKPALELVTALGLEKNILFFGYIPDAELPEFYRRARALIMPTFFGPTNIPPLEAMALGCPVGVSDVYAMRDQLGDAALYFNPASVPEIAQVLERLWLDDDLCRELSRRGLAKSSHNTQSHFNIRLRTILDDVLNT